MSRPAPVSSTNATATWATTRTLLSARTPRLDDALRELLWITAARFVRRMWTTGIRPMSRPTTAVSATAKASTRQSSDAGSDWGSIFAR